MRCLLVGQYARVGGWGGRLLKYTLVTAPIFPVQATTGPHK